MELNTLTAESYREAYEKWKEYDAAFKLTANPLHKQLGNLYQRLYQGQKIVDVAAAIREKGVQNGFYPKLAVARAIDQVVHCFYERSGSQVLFRTQSHYRDQFDWGYFKSDTIVRGMPAIPDAYARNNNGGWHWGAEMKTAVPPIPPKLTPPVLTEDYFILWEVDKWTLTAPVDPWLLRHITGTFFVVLACWNLTALERAVFDARMTKGVSWDNKHVLNERTKKPKPQKQLPTPPAQLDAPTTEQTV